MDTNRQGSSPASPPVATNAGSTPGAIHVDASSMKGQQAFQNAKGPKYYPEDQDTKPAATSIATNAGTPGAISIDASSMKDQQDFRNAKALAGGTSYFPEDHQLQQLPSSLEQEPASSKRAAEKYHDGKLDEEWKESGQAKKTTTESHAMDASSVPTNNSTPGAAHIDASSVQGHSMAAVPLTDEQIKRSAARKDRIGSRTSLSRSMDTAAPMADEQHKRSATSVPTNNSTPGAVHVDASAVQGHSMAAVPMTDEQIKRSAARKGRIVSLTTVSRSNMNTAPITDEQLKRSAARNDRIASRSSLSEDTKQEVEHDLDVENVIPGAVQVSGMDSTDSTTDDQNDTLTMADEDVYSTGDGDKKDGLNIESKHNSTFGGATDVQQKTSAVTSTTTTIVEAQLVEENERELLEEEFRQKMLDEQMGQVAQAEVVEEDGSKTRRRPLRWVCSMIILLAIILGSVLGTRDTSSNAVPVLIPPLNNSLCGEAFPIMLGAGAIEDSLESAIEQVVVFCEFPNQPSDSQRGLWYKYIGQDQVVVAKASSIVALHVYPACDQAVPTCDITDAVYGGSSSSFSSTVTWTAASGVEYLLLVTSTELSSSLTEREFFELELQTVGDPCEDASGPIIPGVGILLLGSTADATIDTQVSNCGSASIPTAPGVWYTLIGDGGAITVSTCTGTDFDSQLSVFTGSSCDQLTCLVGNDQGCGGTGSLIVVQSNQDETYHLLVHGFDLEYGNFALDISTESCGSQLLESDGISRQVIPTDARLDANLPDLPRCFSLSENLPSYGLWYRIIGTGNIMTVLQTESTLLDISGTRISVLSGPTCGQLSCVVTDCIDTTCDWESTADQMYYIFITFIDLIETSFADFLALLPAADLLLTDGVRIVDNDSCDGAFGPISPGEGNSLVRPYFFGSTSTGATIDTVPICDSTSSPTAPGVWYTIIGTGGVITASTFNGTDFDTQLSVFTGSSCDGLTCVDGINDAYGSPSRVDFQSNQNQMYHLLVHGVGGASGTFTLFIAIARLPALSNFLADLNISREALQDVSSPQYAALDWMANADSTDLQDALSDDELLQRFVLVLLYFATGGANWSDQALFLSPSLNICSWETKDTTRVDCNDEGSVVELELVDNRLFGSLPTELVLLSTLQGLYLDNNALTGTLPTQLGNLSSLAFLQLGTNDLSGTVPSEIGRISTLRELQIYSNALTGTVPTQLGSLSSLQFLSLFGTDLTGAVPSELGQISTLQLLYLSLSALNGTMPTQLGSLSVLQELYLNNNELSGAVPSELGQVSTLKLLYLRTNALTGAVPTQLGNLPILRELAFEDNELSGAVPSEIGGMSTLERLHLQRNALTGSVPTQLGSLSSLKILYLNGNKFTGALPSDLGRISTLEQLYLDSNECNGTLPTQLGSLSSLKYLELAENELSGTVPSEIGGMSTVERLFLSSNALTGTLPTQLGNLSSLEDLGLDNNELSGTVPSEIGRISTLLELLLFSNALTGTVPTQLGSLLSLEILDLSFNNLTEAVPAEIGEISTLQEMLLHSNALTGTVPTQLGSLTSLEVLDLSRNDLTGTVPSELGQISTLEELNLDSSGLSGILPPGIDQTQVDVDFP